MTSREISGHLSRIVGELVDLSRRNGEGDFDRVIAIAHVSIVALQAQAALLAAAPASEEEIERANVAEMKRDRMAERLIEDEAERARLRARLAAVNAGPADVWFWQGNGEDKPASLICPVVMSADRLREIFDALRAAGCLKGLSRGCWKWRESTPCAVCRALGKEDSDTSISTRPASPEGTG